MKYGRESLKNLQGYFPGEQSGDGGAIKLNTNENPYPPSPRVMEALRALGDHELRQYPDPLSLRLREACAQRYGYPSVEWVIAGNGMDELLALALRSLVDPGEDICAPYPTYALYEVLCQIHGCALRYIDLDEDFQLTEAFYTTPARMCLLARPNAPSGVSVPRAEVERLCRDFDGLVVIDEAYADFGSDNCLDFPKRFPNVIVMRSFSKSFSLAGVRVGAAVAHPAIINEFLKTKDSYNMSTFCQAAGLAAMQDHDYMTAVAEKVRCTRERLRQALLELGFRVPPSQSNFLLAQWDREPGASEIYEALRQQDILVRYFAAPRLENALRISVGTDEESDALLAALCGILGQES